MLQRDEQQNQRAEKCAACGAPATAGWWERHLCVPCACAYVADAPSTTPLELAHAKAHPEDVEIEGDYEFRDAARQFGEHWVVLKTSVFVRICREAAEAWLEQRKQALARRSA